MAASISQDLLIFESLAKKKIFEGEGIRQKGDDDFRKIFYLSRVSYDPE